MKRWDLPEIEDQDWCPAWLRTAMTGYLQEATRVSRPYAAAAAPIAALLEDAGDPRVVDLCSGAGGPWPGLRESIRENGATDVDVVLTDLHPNPGAIRASERATGVRYRIEPVSALAVPRELTGIRTMFTALHHFGPEQVRAILGAAQRDRVGFAAFEATHRSWKGLLVTLLIPVMVLALMPRVRPVRPEVLLFTYLVPVVPLAIWWDGVVSTLRTYRAAEIARLIRDMEDDTYKWTVAETAVAGLPLPQLQVIGRPVSRVGRG